MGVKRVAINGRVVGSEPGLLAQVGYGHFTAMQVRDRKVRGLALHMARLDAANRELFGLALDREAVLDSIRAVLGDDIADASVRVYVMEGDRPEVIATAKPPIEVAEAPRSLRSVVYQRFLPHIKQAGGFAQAYLMGQVKREGFDEALLTTEDGLISEGAITNVGCFDGDRVVWPDAPMLRGITMQLLEEVFAAEGVVQERRPLKVSDLPGYDLVFLTNSHGVVVVDRVDAQPLKVDENLRTQLAGWYRGIPGDLL
ncbi:aminotransferase class IV [Rhizohabitans arisaemae]|uniref:aminotransferase class IV n=1 Tax=Rhizohabitans arisaemae TaxID=2720610 RepID=UPI0024B0A31D|nr:aminotransferase class IV [Rhizohabitans arisaemae]